MTNTTTKTASPIIRSGNHNSPPQANYSLCFKNVQEKDEYLSETKALTFKSDSNVEFALIQGLLFRLFVRPQDQSGGPKPGRLEINVR